MVQPQAMPGFGIPGQAQVPGQVSPGVPGQPQQVPTQVPAGAVAASFNPDSMVEGGGPPIQQNLLVKEATICYYNYNGKSPQSVCSRLVFVNDAGETLQPQYYSIGDPTKFMPSLDGTQVMMLGGQSGISKSSNHGILMKGCADAGFPQPTLNTGNIKVLEGLYAYWDGVTPPARTGLANPDGGGRTERRESTVTVPTVIHRLPGVQGTHGIAQTQAPVAPVAPMAVPSQPQPVAPGAPPVAAYAPMVPGQPLVQVPQQPTPIAPPQPVAPTMQAPPQPPQPQVSSTTQPVPAGGVDLNAYAAGITDQLGGNFSLQQAMNLVYTQYPNDPQFRDTLANYVFSPEFSAYLTQQGWQVQGHQVSK